MKIFIALILRPLILAIALVVAAFAAKADKGIKTTVDVGDYRFTVICHYEPEQHGEVTYIDIVNPYTIQRSDTLRFPTEVVVYGDTFPVTIARNPLWGNNYIQPSVLDCANLRVFIDNSSITGERYDTHITGWNLREVIFGENMDSIDAHFGTSSLVSVDLKNIKYIGDSFNYVSWRWRPSHYLDAKPQLRYVKMSPYLTNISEKAFANSAALEEIDLSNVKKIEAEAFSGSGLKTVSLPKAEVIGPYAFSKTPLEKFEINRDVIREIHFTALTECSKLKSIEWYDAEISYYLPHGSYGTIVKPFNAFLNMDSLEYLQSANLHYLTCLKSNLTFDLPNLIAVGNQFNNTQESSHLRVGIKIEDLPNLKEISVSNSRIDKMEIGDSLAFGFISGFRTYTGWCPIQLINSSVDSVTISPRNTDFYIKDSILYLRKPVKKEDGGYIFKTGKFISLNTYLINDLDYLDEYTRYYNVPESDLAVAPIGFPRGEWFYPKSFPILPQNYYLDLVPIPTYCCDFVDKIALGEGSDLSTYRLNTFDREGDKPILVFADLDKVKAEQVLECCLSPLMQFVVPKGKLGRFIAAGFPQDRLIEDVDGTLALDTIGADTMAPARQGTYDISGRRIPSGIPLAPGIYIIDGRKTIIR